MCLDDTTVRVPLRAKDGSVRAYALIDAADRDFINQWRWHLGSKGYASRSADVGGGRIRTIRLHRELLGLPRINDGKDGDHINRDRLDNRRANLRIATKADNRQNVTTGWSKYSQHRGVVRGGRNHLGNTWYALVHVRGQRTRLGPFGSEIEASEAAKEARLRLMPFAVD